MSSYVALYRAYRPQIFSEIAGQKHIVRTLQNAIKLNKIAHAYLFCGPRGTGKTTLAKIVAKILNCENVKDLEPCNKCQTCLDINKGIVSDVIEIDAASNNGVDEIRELKEKVKFPPINKYKIYIIDEVHMLTTAAFNALLKTLEEPPKNTIFILATTEVQKIPGTILSRCQRFDFTNIGLKDVYNRLEKICKNEKIQIDLDALSTISEICDGGLRDALSLLDQCLSYSTTQTITLENVLNVSGSINKNILLDMISSCVKKDGPKALKELNELVESGKELPKITNDLISFLRDILLFKVNAYEVQKQIFNDVSFINFTKVISTKQIYTYLSILNEVQNNMRFSSQKRTFLELGLLSMANAINEYDHVVNDKISLLEEKIKDLETKLNQQSIIEKKVTTNLVVENKASLNDLVQEKSFVDTLQTPKEDFSIAFDETIDDFLDESTKSIKNHKLNDNEYISIEMIQNVLNNGDKEKKKQIQYIIKEINKKTSNPDTDLLSKATVVAASSDCCILVLDEEALCNRIMRSQTYSYLLDLINNDKENIKTFMTLFTSLWDKIKGDYMVKYKNSFDKKDIKLDFIKINIKKPIYMEVTKSEDPDFDELLELFDPSKIQIKEN